MKNVFLLFLILLFQKVNAQGVDTTFYGVDSFNIKYYNYEVINYKVTFDSSTYYYKDKPYSGKYYSFIKHKEAEYDDNGNVISDKKESLTMRNTTLSYFFKGDYNVLSQDVVKVNGFGPCVDFLDAVDCWEDKIKLEGQFKNGKRVGSWKGYKYGVLKFHIDYVEGENKFILHVYCKNPKTIMKKDVIKCDEYLVIKGEKKKTENYYQDLNKK